MKITICALLVFSSLCCIGQSVKSDLMRVKEIYSKSHYLSMNVAVTGFKDEYAKTGLLLGKGEMVKDGTNYFSNFMDDQLVFNKAFMLFINKKQRKITVCKRKSQKESLPLLNLNIDSLLTTADSIISFGDKNGERHYCFYQNNAPVWKTDLYIDLKTFLVNKITYLNQPMSDKERIELKKIQIIYSNINLNAIENNPIFYETNYIHIESGKITPALAYKNYKITVEKN